MNSWQAQKYNTDFVLRCMMIKRGSGLPKEDLDRLHNMIEKEEKHLIVVDELNLRGSFHKRILYNLSDDKRVKDYMKELEETDYRVSLHTQLGIIEALKDFFDMKPKSMKDEIKEILDRNFERAQAGNLIVIKRDDVIGRKHDG